MRFLYLPRHCRLFPKVIIDFNEDTFCKAKKIHTPFQNIMFNTININLDVIEGW
jgi:hypothetical protein